MSTYYSADLNRDIDRYQSDQDNALKGLPVCCECDEPIQDDECYMFDDKLICPACLELNHRRYVDEFIS